MLKVTEAALRELSSAANAIQEADSEDSSADVCFRVVPRNGASLGLAFQTPAPDDATFDHEGTTVLAVPKELLDFCANHTLDIDSDGQLILE